MRRFVCAAVSFIVAVSVVVGLAPHATAATCLVKNTRDRATFTRLQAAVDVAVDGDTLTVSGTCVGKASIRGTRLVLEGVPTTGQPTPTLNGGGISRVLRIFSAKVVIRDLTITNGTGSRGGGIECGSALLSRPSRLTLRGDTRVTANTARYGGGIDAHDCPVTLNGRASVTGNTAKLFGGGLSAGVIALNDSASVTGNTAGIRGGGIWIGGTLTLNGSASVTGNTAAWSGGGIYNAGIATLRNSASVTGNTAVDGGGIYSTGEFRNPGTVTLKNSASITGNTAEGYGGGIYTIGRNSTVTLYGTASVTVNAARAEGGGIYPSRRDRLFVCSDQVAISPNDPDDPPAVLPCT